MRIERPLVTSAHVAAAVMPAPTASRHAAEGGRTHGTHDQDGVCRAQPPVQAE